MKVLEQNVTSIEQAISLLRRHCKNATQERVGFLLSNGDLTEARNIHPHPDEEIFIANEDLFTAITDLGAISWHNHPKSNSNLSVADHLAFKNYPTMKHLIIGRDGDATLYGVEQDAVLIEEQYPCK